jgi:hypothetical protein
MVAAVGFLCLQGGFGLNFVSSGTSIPCTDVVSSGDNGRGHQERINACVWMLFRPGKTELP